MARGPHGLDQCVGSLPEIRMGLDGITYIISAPGVPRGHRMTIRFGVDGEVWIAIHSDQTSIALPDSDSTSLR
jgi:hypothetical protein